MKFIHYLNRLYLFNLGLISPIKLSCKLYNTTTGKVLDIDHPQDLNEKVHAMKFKLDTSKWSILADKYEVRNYIIQNGYANYLPKNYYLTSNPFKINKNILPEKCVIKTTNGSSTVIIVNDKSKITNLSIWKKLIYWKLIPFGIITAEPHYRKIKCRYIVEELLENVNPQSSSLIDYKFYCFYGKVEACLVCADRDKNEVYKILYDNNWNLREDWMNKMPTKLKDINKPISYDKMVEMCNKLGKDFPFVRIDFYEINGNPIFGEMTFTPAGGNSTVGNTSFLKLMGDKIKIL